MKYSAIKHATVVLLAFGLVACGGDDDATAPETSEPDDASTPATDESPEGDNVGGDDTGDDGANSGGGEIVHRQPAGSALVSVDGQEFTMTEPGALACSLADDSITFSFRIGDNEVTLGAGANKYDTGWLGAITLVVPSPAGEEGVTSYFPDLVAHGDRLVIDGDSASYSGPMQKQPPNDGSNPPPVDAGDGIISITCP